MKTIKLKNSEMASRGYTGIAEWEAGDKGWFNKGEWHREDGPAYVGLDGYLEWWLEGFCIWDSHRKLDLTNQYILSKSQHPLYPTVQVWKILNKDRVYEQIVIPGMEEFIIE